ncbi:NAD(P)H-binding protein [Silvibacterium sp.]|uniref:NmrA family NAD(P)-binding protein n=1 Tax=Silvibacterium sp. TaxID=1964179 RepID=UPI0039E43AA6
MIVVTTPTGNIGSKLIPHLFEAGEHVTVIARNPAKLNDDVRARVRIVVGSSDDEAVLLRALEGAEGLFHVVPPSPRLTNDRAFYLQFTEPAIRAVARQGVKRVVSVSGLGRKSPLKAGVVSASFAKDEAWEQSGVDFRALWCPGFLDNFLHSVSTLREQGVFFGPQRGDVKSPKVATRDIAATAARLLVDRTWSGQGGLAVLGPEDLSYEETAAILTEVLGRPIRYQQISGETYKAQLTQRGATPEFADSLLEMFAAKDRGLDNIDPRTAENTTPTSFRAWAEEVLKPLIVG